MPRWVTIADIARAAGVSKPVVSKVLHDRGGNTRVSPATAVRVQAVAERLGYRPHASARAMASGGTAQLGVLLPHAPGNPFTHPAAFETVIGIDASAHEQGRATVLANLDDARAGLHKMRIIRERMVDGLCVLGLLPSDLEETILRAAPAIWVDGNRWAETGCLRRDEVAAGHLLGERVAACGYRRCLFYGYAPDHSEPHFSSAARWQGLHAALTAAGIPLERRVEADVSDSAAHGELLAHIAPEVAVIADSIYQAMQLRALVETAGLLPGRDFGLGCCDDMQQCNRWWPQLTRAAFPRYILGLRAGVLLENHLRDGRAPPSELMPTKLLLGDTLRSR